MIEADCLTFYQAYRELRLNDLRLRNKADIEQKIKTYNPDLIEQAALIRSIVGGDVYNATKKGIQPEIWLTNKLGFIARLAKSFLEAKHAFIVDEHNNVWDPIANIWGTKSKRWYLDHLH